MRRIVLAFLFTASGANAAVIDSPESRSLGFLTDSVEVTKEIRHHLYEFVHWCANTLRSEICKHNLRSLISVKVMPFDRDDDAIGVCWRCGSGKRYVQIKEGYTDSDSMLMKSIAYHEFGHCLLDLNHQDGLNIMRPNVVDPEQSGTKWHLLLDKLKSQEPHKIYMDEKEEKAKRKEDKNDPC
jgi:hypothetical protein